MGSGIGGEGSRGIWDEIWMGKKVLDFLGFCSLGEGFGFFF